MASRLVISLLACDALGLALAGSKQEYLNHAIDAANILCQSYNSNNGLFDGGDGAGWWTAANAVTTIGNLAALHDSLLGTAEVVFATTFTKAPYALVAARYNVQRGTFLDDFFDDQGWWALAWIKAYDLTGNGTYLDEAQSIFDDIDAARNGHCGGRPWTRIAADNQINSITNELYFAVAASLANRVSGEDKALYRGLAHYQADWFDGSGLLGSGGDGLIVDALEVASCRPNTSSIVWAYNQGVILGAFVEMHRLTGEQRYLDSAHTIARGVTSRMVSGDGILTEHGFPDVQKGAEQFKGVLARNLMYLHQASPDQGYADFLQKNANSIWQRAKGGDGRIGVGWQGPVENVDAVSHGSGLDCLVAAAAVAR